MSWLFFNLCAYVYIYAELNEDWDETTRKPLEEGITFHCKYLGSTLVEETADMSTTAEAIKTIIAMVSMHV